MNLLTLFISALISNLIFTRALGMSTLAVSAKSNRNFIGTGLAITLFTILGSGAAYIVTPLFTDIQLLLPLCYICIIALMYVAALLILHTIGNNAFLRFRKYIHLSAFNCAVLGTLLLIPTHSGTFFDALSFGFQSGIGFLIASFILKAVYPALTSEKVPASVRGYPAILLYIGILAMALYGINQ